MALYPAAIKRLIPPGPNDPRIKPRVLIFHIAMSEGSTLYHYFNGPSGGIESHFYVRRDGTVEQYRDTDWEADANTDANRFAISVETQGMEYGEWTPEQMAALKGIATWCKQTHGIPLETVAQWDGRGVGYHTQFPGRWDKRGATCPGPDRKRQFAREFVPWMEQAGTSGGAQSSEPKPRSSKGGDPKPKPTKPAPTAPAFPLPAGHWYGVESSDPRNHSGYWSKDRAGIKQWQTQMKKRGWSIVADGRFGPQSQSVAKAFQREKRISADGAVGIVTWRAAWSEPVT